MTVTKLGTACAALAALVHGVFFLFESVLFTHPAVQERFRVAPEAAEAIAPFAFNQGFYNLFLAAGIGVGLLLVRRGQAEVGRALVAYVCAVMVGAGLVLLGSVPELALGALIQAGPPGVALACLVADRQGAEPAPARPA